MSPRLVRSGLAIPAVAAQVVAMVAVLDPAAAPAVAGAALAGAVVCAVVAVRRGGDRRWVLAAATALAIVAVLASVAVAEPRRHPPGLPVGHVVQATVRIDAVGTSTGNDHAGALVERGILTGVLLRVRAGGAAVDVDAPVRLFLAGAPGRLVPGAVVTLTTALRRADPTDAVAYLGSAGGVRVASPAPALAAVADRLRAGFSNRASRLPGDGGALLPGLAIGDVRTVPEDLTQAMRDASLSHLTAVSGANCAVVIAGVLALGALLRVPRLLRLLFAAVALGGFVVLVTPQPSVVRAAVMAAVVLASLARGHPVRGVPVLAVAVLVLLVLDPWYAWSAGFVLSVLATGGLLLLTGPIADRLGRFLPRRVALLVAVPIAAQLACQPVLVLLQPSLPLGGVLANLLAEPAAPVATVLGLLACLLGPVVPAVAGGLTMLAWVPAAWIALVARVAGGLPQLPWSGGVAGAVGAAAVVAALLLLVVRGVPVAARVLAGVLVVGGGLLAGGVAVGGAIATAARFPTDWDLAACDVGQGDGLVLNGGGGHFAVVDTGREPEPIRACLDRLGVRRIELLVLTHWDADHVGAARSLAGRTAAAFVGPSDGGAADDLRRSLVASGVRVLQPHRGDSVRVGRDVLQVLWPPDPLGAVQPGNAASITLLVAGRFTTLMEGDLGEDAQDALLAAGPLPRVDVVKVAHHGSADQSPAFYAALDARLGIISVGADNDYGHPTARLLGILRAVGTPAVRTDQDGMVLVSAIDGRLSVWTEHPITSAVWQPAHR